MLVAATLLLVPLPQSLACAKMKGHFLPDRIHDFLQHLQFSNSSQVNGTIVVTVATASTATRSCHSGGLIKYSPNTVHYVKT